MTPSRPPRGRPESRALAPTIGKTLEIGIGVLLVALLTTAFYGSVIPDARTAAGAELGERALADAARATDHAVPPAGSLGTMSVRIDLPPTIRGATYRIEARGTQLALEHPHPGIGHTIPLPLPANVLAVEGSWESTDPFVVETTASRSGARITIGGTA